MNDELKKLGLRIRPRTVEPRTVVASPPGLPPRQDKPGKIAFDDRGNAVYAWNDDRLTEDGEQGERARRRALAHPTLTLMDEEPAANAPIRTNTKGLRVGYNPYESGLLAKKQWKKKTDLRELSKWLETKRKAQEGSEE